MAARIATSARTRASKAKSAGKAAAAKPKLSRSAAQARVPARAVPAAKSKPNSKKSAARPNAAAPTRKRSSQATRKPAKQPAATRGVARTRRKSVAVRAPRSAPSPARDALKARAMKQVIADVFAPPASGSAVVDAYLRELDHPFKAEMAAVREIILGASPQIAERIKWNAPSFYYKEDLAAFNPRANEYAHLILLFPGGVGMPAKGSLLEGKHKDRREAKFHSLADVTAKQPALEKLIRNWVKLRDL